MTAAPASAPDTPEMVEAIVGRSGVLTALNLYPFLQAEEKHRDHQATEAVLLTYNVDLNFFESRLLGILQATGATVTVVADGTVWEPDPRAVKYAGRSYHAGIMQTGGSFHPKLLALAGPDRGLLAIGSGNLTLGGWQYNAEVLTVATADSTGVPTIFYPAAALLDDIADHPSLDPLASTGLHRTSRALRELINAHPALDTGHEFVSSTTGPILERLPFGPVDELLLTAPFHDLNARAIDRLLQRLRPLHTQIAVQPGWTSLDKTALERVLNQWATTTGGTWQLLRDAENAETSLDAEGGPGRYRHGKLVEWTVQGERHGLVGSPNLSVAALLKATAEGGNLEVAVLGPLDSTLFPPGTHIDFADLPDIPAGADPDTAAEGLDDTASAPATLTAAICTETGIEIHFSPTTRCSARVEISRRKDDPDEWEPLVTVPADIRAMQVTATPDHAIPSGSRLRTSWSADPNATPPQPAGVGRTVFVAHPLTIRNTVATMKRSRAHQADGHALVGDEVSYLDAVLDELLAYREDIAAFTADGPPTPATSKPKPSGALNPSRPPAAGGEADGPGAWLWEQTTSIKTVGHGLTAFALGLNPRYNGMGTAPDDAVPWADRLADDDELALDTDTAETPPAVDPDDPSSIASATATAGDPDMDPDGPPAPPDHSATSNAHKKKRRVWCTQVTAVADSLTLTSRLFALRTTLVFWSAGNWERDDVQPIRLVDSLIASLRKIDTPEPDSQFNPAIAADPEMAKRIASMVVVALTVTRALVDLSARDERTRTYQRMVASYADLTSDADTDLLAQYVQFLRNNYGYPLIADDAEHTWYRMQSPNPSVSEAVDILKDRDWTVSEIADDLLVVTNFTSTPELAALETVATAQYSDHVAAYAVSAERGWALAAWVRPHLVVVTGGTQLTRWRHQVCPASYTPAAAHRARANGEPAKFVQAAKAKHAPTVEARGVLLDAFEISDPDPVANIVWKEDPDPDDD